MRFHRLLRAVAVLVGAVSLVLVSAPPAGAAGTAAATAGAPVMNGQATNNPHSTTTTVAPAPTTAPAVTASSTPSGGANTSGAYDPTANGSPSLNGGGNGFATGKPAAGSVGNADDKNPQGQHPWGKPGADKNKGYECDANHGIGKGNPAHSACVTTPVTVPETPTTVPTTIPTQVLGEQITRTLPAASVAGSHLARTGFPVAGSALVGLALLVVGGVIWWMARRHGEEEGLTS